MRAPDYALRLADVALHARKTAAFRNEGDIRDAVAAAIAEHGITPRQIVHSAQPDRQRISRLAADEGFSFEGLWFNNVRDGTGGAFGLSLDGHGWPKYSESLRIAIRERARIKAKKEGLVK